MEGLNDWTLTSGAFIFFATINYVLGAYCGTIRSPEQNTPGSILIPFNANANLVRVEYGTTYRWIFNKSTVIKINGEKYGLNGTSLIIYDVGKSDEGFYKVDCRNLTEVSVELRLDNGIAVVDVTTGTTRVTIKGPTKHPSTITTPTEPPMRTVGEASESDTLSNENITLIVVSLSALGVAVTVAVIIISKRNRSNQEGGETLVNRKKDTSVSLAGDDDYNQINTIERYVTDVTRDSSVLPDCNSGSDYALIDETLMIDPTAATNHSSCDTLRSQLTPRVGSSSNDGVSAYSNIRKTSNKQKSGTQAPEITYVTLEHDVSGVPCCSDVTDRKQSTVDAGNLTKEYAIIDFAREAFVAPIRKAPSSWYKRKKKGKS